MGNAYQIKKELDRIAKKHDGILKARDVVNFARTHKKSALHSRFTWDDAEAAEAHRLWQARNLIISVKMIINMDGTPQCVRPLVSMCDDRYNDNGGGYRSIFDVKQDPDLWARYLEEAFAELSRIRNRYSMFPKLVDALDQLIESDLFETVSVTFANN